jgi:hypothetical protein
MIEGSGSTSGSGSRTVQIKTDPDPGGKYKLTDPTDITAFTVITTVSLLFLAGWTGPRRNKTDPDSADSRAF